MTQLTQKNARFPNNPTIVGYVKLFFTTRSNLCSIGFVVLNNNLEGLQMRTILNFLKILPVFALAFFIGSIAVALIHSAAFFTAIPHFYWRGCSRAGVACLGLMTLTTIKRRARP
jgi:hypothetical protein